MENSRYEHVALIFEIGTDKSLFDGLYISQNKSLCDEHMGKYPVIFISLKDVEGLSYDEAFQVFSRIIGNEISKFSFWQKVIN